MNTDIMTFVPARCIRCKSNFDKSDTNARLCPECKKNNIVIVKERAKLYIKKQVEKRRSLRPDVYVKNCPYCNILIMSKEKQRKYCSATCKSKCYTVKRDIKTTKEQVKRLNKRLRFLNKVLERNKIKIYISKGSGV
tara:strand:+ start:561 stop:971 length:411 start_codon:yes stop_codon:yes gene_type:complete